MRCAVSLFQSLQLPGDLMVHDGITLVRSLLGEQNNKSEAMVSEGYLPHN